MKNNEQLLSQQITELKRQLVMQEDLHHSLKEAQLENTLLKQSIANCQDELIQERLDHAIAVKELRMSELIVERSPVILFRRVADPTATLEYISQNLEQFGYDPKEFLSGKMMFKDIIHPDDFERVKEEILAYADADVEEYTMTYRCMTKAGDARWVEDQTTVVRDEKGIVTHNQGILYDITDEKNAANTLRKSEEKFRRIVETASEGFVLFDQDFKIIDFNDAYCKMLGYSSEELQGKCPFDLASDDFRAEMLVNKETIMTQEYRKLEGTLVTKDGHHIPVLIHGNTLRSDQGDIIGNMAFVTDMTEHKKALMLAGEVQKSLLPQQKPIVKGLDIAGKTISCDEIGGDYYDFISRQKSGSGPFNVVVGDISGHGVDSALLMTTARAFLRMRASQPGSISEIISSMNHHLVKDVLETSRFMTLFYLSLNPEEKSIEWVRAGHDPALLYDPHKESFEELKGSGIALGVADDIKYHVNKRTDLANDQIIAVGTDGIWEAFNPEGEMFGKARFKKIIQDHAHQSASVILEMVYEELKQFTAGKKSEDDITLVIIKASGLTT